MNILEKGLKTIKIVDFNKNRIWKNKNINVLTEEFIIKARIKHGDKYDYSKVKYIKSIIPITITCYIHGDFNMTTPNSHLRGCGCPECGKEKAASISKSRTLTTEQFIEKVNEIHDNKYDYSKVNYINTRGKIIIICPKHGEFEQRASSHLHSKHGCPICKESQGEKYIASLLNENNINFIPQMSFPDLIYKRLMVFDFYLPELNSCIEFDGMQHFSHVKYFGKNEKLFIDSQIRDKLKTEYCKKNKISFLRLTYKDNENKIKSKLFNFLKLKT